MLTLPPAYQIRRRRCRTCGGSGRIFGRRFAHWPCPDCCGAGGYSGSGTGSLPPTTGTGIASGSGSGPAIITAPCSNACIGGRIPARLLLIVGGVALGPASPNCDDVSYFNKSIVFDYCLYDSFNFLCCYKSPIECVACCLPPSRVDLTCQPANRWHNFHSHSWNICLGSWNPPGPVTQATKIRITSGLGFGNAGVCRTSGEYAAACPDDCAVGPGFSDACSNPGFIVEIRLAEKIDCTTINASFDATAPGSSVFFGGANGAPWLDTSALTLSVTAI